MCYNVIEDHGGTIKVDSGVCKGLGERRLVSVMTHPRVIEVIWAGDSMIVLGQRTTISRLHGGASAETNGVS